MSTTSRQEIDNLLRSADTASLNALSALICSSPHFNRAQPNYALPEALFAFVEGLLWLSQSLRSGTRTYFEATPVERQQRMLEALLHLGAGELPVHYAAAMQQWQIEGACTDVDRWIVEHEDWWDRWLCGVVASHRTELYQTLL